MTKTKFVFDETTGTMKPESDAESRKQAKTNLPPKSLVEAHKKTEEVSVDLSTEKPNVDMNEPQVMFRQNSDYTVFQVTDERTGKPMMIIAGYGLEMKFNMAELRTTAKVDSLVEALGRLFREMIIQQAVEK